MTAHPDSAKRPRRRAALGLAVAGLLGVLASVPITGCGGGERIAEATGITVTHSASTRTTPTRTAPAIETTAPSTTTTPSVSPPVTVTETAPAETVTTPEIQTETVIQTTPPNTTTSSSPTTGVNPAAAAAAAAAASQDDDSTQWGWIAFGILAVAVVIFGVGWWFRKRHATGNGDGGTPTAVSG
jgi:cobalamin biosynthesis Mg chelatase CobN